MKEGTDLSDVCGRFPQSQSMAGPSPFLPPYGSNVLLFTLPQPVIGGLTWPAHP